MRHAERSEVALVGGEDSEVVGRGRGGNGDVLETGIVRPRAIEDRAGLAGFLMPKARMRPA